MGSGLKRMLFSSRERLVSTDHHRLQAFFGRDLGELFRYAFDAPSPEEQNAGGLESTGSAVTAPLRAVIHAGLRARPLNGTTSLLIEPGVVQMIDPETAFDSDDSVNKIVIDPGQQLPGVLNLTAGAGSTRIDVIECSRTELTVESDNRDVFDPSTGLFTAIAVSKVTRGALTYRIRVGTPGAGYPGSASGWLPLAVAAVPSTATTWDHVSLWDVRPLSADDLHPMGRLSRELLSPSRQHVGFDFSAPIYRQKGYFETSYGTKRAGGVLRSGPIGTLNDFIPLRDFASLPPSEYVDEPGVVFVSGELWYLWFVFPHGLPRWCRYSEIGSAVSPRQPYGPCGVPVITTKGPTNMRGDAPVSAIALPTVLGLGGSHSTAALAFGGECRGGTPVPSPQTNDGVVSWMAEGTGPALVAAASVANSSVTWAPADNTKWPATVRAVWLKITYTVTTVGTAGTLSPELRTYADLDGLGTIEGPRMYTPARYYPASTASFTQNVIRVPLQPTYPHALGLATGRQFFFSHGAPAGATVTVPVARVIGWELG